MANILKISSINIYVKILIAALSITLDIFSMKKALIPKSERDRSLLLQKDHRSLSQMDELKGTTFIQKNKNSGNSLNKSNVNDNKNNFSPKNYNVSNFIIFGGSLADPEFYRGIVGRITNLYKVISEYVKNNKKIVFSGLITSFYLALNLRLYYLHYKLKSSKCWSQWRSSLELEELYLIPRLTLYNDLLTNIQTKYINFKNFRDKLAPLSKFLEDVEQEESYIKQYEYIVKALKWIHIGNFIFYSNNLYKQLSKRYSRLIFIKGAFLNWYAENNKISLAEKEVLVRRFPRVKDILESKEFNIDSSQIEPLAPEESTELILEKIIQV